MSLPRIITTSIIKYDIPNNYFPFRKKKLATIKNIKEYLFLGRKEAGISNLSPRYFQK